MARGKGRREVWSDSRREPAEIRNSKPLALSSYYEYETAMEESSYRNEFQNGGPLFARHLCPSCPKGVSVAKSGSSRLENDKAAGAKPDVVFCCPPPPRIKTITKTVKVITRFRTKTVRRTRSTTLVSCPINRVDRTYQFDPAPLFDQAPFVIQGRLYKDINKNDRWDLGTDVPFANEPVVLLALPATGSRRRIFSRSGGGISMATAVTDALGQFLFTVRDPSPIAAGTVIGIATQAEPDVVLKSFQADSSGQVTYMDTPIVETATKITTTRLFQQTGSTNLVQETVVGAPWSLSVLHCNRPTCAPALFWLR